MSVLIPVCVLKTTPFPTDGNELNLMNTLSAIGIMVGSPFSTLALTKIQPRYWLPLCTMLWSFCVLGIYPATDVRTIYALRYVVGSVS